MYSYNDKGKSISVFNFLWRCGVLIGLFFLYKQIYYIAELMSAYVRMLLQAGSF